MVAVVRAAVFTGFSVLAMLVIDMISSLSGVALAFIGLSDTRR
jgi:hypothetical protein